MNKPDWLVEGNVIEFNGLPDVASKFRKAKGTCKIVRVESTGKSLSGGPYFFDARVITSDIYSDRIPGAEFGFHEKNFVRLVKGDAKSGAPLDIPKDLPENCRWQTEEKISEIEIPQHLQDFVYHGHNGKLIADGCDADGAFREINALKEEQRKRSYRLRREWPICHRGGTVKMRWAGTALVYACSRCCDGDRKLGGSL